MKPNRQESDSQQAQNEEALFRAIVSLRDTTDCGNFLRDLCTPAELQALVDRWTVVRYRRIHDLTGVSVTTIGRVARFLTDGFGGYQAALDRADTDRGNRSH